MLQGEQLEVHCYRGETPLPFSPFLAVKKAVFFGPHNMHVSGQKKKVTHLPPASANLWLLLCSSTPPKPELEPKQERCRMWESGWGMGWAVLATSTSEEV